MRDYDRWLTNVKDETLLNELKSMNDEQKEAAFYKDLEFGTGGLRGLLGAGSACLNIYTIGKVSQGIALYAKKHYGENASVAISYDSRINSELFARHAASVYAANGLKVYLYPALMPTPLLSYAVRYLHTSIGVMITASHNPKEYNGYKVYNDEGCQITLEAANEMVGIIESLDVFLDTKTVNFTDALEEGKISYITPDCLNSYLDYIKTKEIASIKERDLKIVYSPLNGTGLVPVTRALSNAGFANVSLVEEQKNPDGTFRTCPKPNPELKEALKLGIELLNKEGADLLLVTDPDCDRVGTAVKYQGEIRLISGNEMGLLLYDFLLHHKEAVPGSVLVKTIVTSDMVLPLAKDAGMKVIQVLTGFKFIGEQIGKLEKEGHEERFYFGYEESYGYLSGTKVRDKDAVDASLLIAFMMQEFKTAGKNPIDRLLEISEKYGYTDSALENFEFPGPKGAATMANIMKNWHSYADTNKDEFLFVNDYLSKVSYENGEKKEIDLPSSDVLKFGFHNGNTFTVRPSGTEPKIKIYYYVVSSKEEGLAGEMSSLKKKVNELMKKFEK